MSTYLEKKYIHTLAIAVTVLLLSACGGSLGEGSPDALFSVGANQWLQSDWSGGVGPSTTNQYSSATGIQTATPNQITLEATTSWFDTDWKYRQAVTITNAGALQTDYQVRFIVNYTAGMQPDFADLRFTNGAGALLDHWIQEKTDSVEAIAWVEVDSLAAAGDTAIQMYFGNAAAPDASNGEGTFIFFDGFNDTVIDPAKWTVVDPGGEISETGGKLRFERIPVGSWNRGLYGNITYARSDLSFDFDYLWVTNNPIRDSVMFGWHDNGASASYTSLVYADFVYATGGAVTASPRVYEDSASRGGSVGAWAVGTDYILSFKMRTAGGCFYERSEDGGDTWLATYTSVYSVESDLRPGWAFHTGIFEFDNARIRKWMTIEPTTAFGAIEERYVTNGSLTSGIFETHAEGSIWGVLSYVSSGAGTIEVKARTSNDATMASAPDFSLCVVTPSGTDLASDNCVSDGHRYIQYFVRLIGSNVDTPVLQSISILHDNADVIANAGPDRTVSIGRSITIDGSASAGLELNYNWTLLQGDGTLEGIQSSMPTYSVGSQASNQTVEIELTVRNILGETHSDTVLVQVITEQPAVEDNTGIVGNVGGTIIYRVSNNNLLIGNTELALTDSSSRFTLASTSDNQILVGVSDADDDTGTAFFLAQDGSTIGQLNGNQAGDLFGSYVAVGDINGDDLEEILISAPGAGDYGKIYIYDLALQRLGILVGAVDYPLNSLFIGNYLATNSNSVIFGPGNLAQNPELSDYPVTAVDPLEYAFMIANRQYFGGTTIIDSNVVEATAGTGAMHQTVFLADLIGDGARDLIMAATDGNVYIFFDQQTIGTDLPIANASVVISGGTAENMFGYVVASGDVSGDGRIDLIIGAPSYGSDQEGAVFVIFGRDVWESTIDITTTGYVLGLYGTVAGESIGKEILLADVNDDGILEIYTVKGRNTTVRFDLTGTMPITTSGSCSLHSGKARPSSIAIVMLLLLATLFAPAGIRQLHALHRR